MSTMLLRRAWVRRSAPRAPGARSTHHHAHAVILRHQDFVAPAATSGAPVVILHGLLGSGRNWGTVARALAQNGRTVHTLDLRNHGESPHTAEMTYPLMAEDVLRFLDAREIDRAAIVGHSMGGKVAMTLATHHPTRVGALGVIDISPLRYASGTLEIVQIFNTLNAVKLEGHKSRATIEKALAESIKDTGLRQFLLTNVRLDSGGYKWRVNMAAIERFLGAVAEEVGGKAYSGPTWFIRGERSNYVPDSHIPQIRAMFPQAHIVTVENAGHMVHADAPERVIAAIGSIAEAADAPAPVR